ncbi:Lrp/AsnC family transcriptional regulator [Agrobacterium larrymoorei]|uniref:Lrp/AsnC family transcriptional regulator n=1 Tax=Agrobacterium larrymoorei TaxID=160699 RepID=A0A4D7E6J6_9HYPH|nr:Lrp/AsnC family transcriptional regulator [Agrobacterium larrymoorei]QCJ01021.1 Lrp/AsnC family transcriptional regulator [Agrobacterium larrymoorei]QYA10357.1 Lrp/AsnC family transcriptional regulator [Agrobacterium larrymoorei]
MGEPLDAFDKHILRIVQCDCQLKAETIAGMVGLSASAVQRRLKRMRETRVISSEIAVIDRKSVGNPMTFITGMEIERENYDALSKFRLWAEQQQNIQQIYYVTGAVDLIAIISADDVSQYDDITAHIMSENPQIKRIHTNVVLKELKVGLFLPVP